MRLRNSIIITCLLLVAKTSLYFIRVITIWIYKRVVLHFAWSYLGEYSK